MGFVDNNDILVMTFCAHTYDQESASFADGTKLATEIASYLIPTWDSYSGKWTSR